VSESVPQRIGDADRDQAVDCLREHLAQGRLSQDEFEERLQRAITAKTAADLQPLFVDLPEPRPNTVQGIAPMPTPWPASRPPAQATPPAPPASQPQMSSGAATALTIATAVAWPVWLLVSFATSWRFWWLVFIPIIISAAAGAVRAQSSGGRPELDR
jgi:hypothetical protein